MIDPTKGDVDPTGKRPGPWMQTAGGRQFFPLDLRAEDLDIEDIAHSLGALCRYNGHTNQFYSVAEHSVLMMWEAKKNPHVTTQYLRTVLLHDAAEAYIGDYPYAIKRVIPGIKRLEESIELVLALKFGLDQSSDTWARVKQLDRRIVRNEREALMPGPHPWVADAYEPLGVTIRCWGPEQARRTFMDAYKVVKQSGGTNDD